MSKEEAISLKEYMQEQLSRIGVDVKDLKTAIDKNTEMTESILIQATKTNGRVTAIEEWSGEAKKIIEKISQDAKDANIDYTINKTRIWTAITLLIFFGGTIITLSVIAIDNKIQKGIQQALLDNVKEINYEDK